MRRLALQGSVRRRFAPLHRWSGLSLLVMPSLAAATGVVRPFRDGIERWLNPELHVVAGAPPGALAGSDVFVDPHTRDISGRRNRRGWSLRRLRARGRINQ